MRGNYTDDIYRMYYFGTGVEPGPSASRDITFQVTDDCCCACTYCYQGNKGHRVMSKETARKAVDLLFRMYDEDSEFINHNTKGIVLDFIGGEPLMAIDVIDYICTYFMEQCMEKDHPWIYTFRISMVSNGALYFEEKVQRFLRKFRGFLSFGVTIDGPKEIHDACRVYHDGRGNFEDAYAAQKHYIEEFHGEPTTKVTIAPENLKDLNRIVRFFAEDGIREINANTVYETNWTYDHAKLFYKELKKMADYLLERRGDVCVSLFREDSFCPMSEENNENWCGGTGRMLAFDPDGIAYPCVRYMPSSLSGEAPPLVVGSVEGIFHTDEERKIKCDLDSITRRSQSTDECWNCPVADGCSWCSAWNYQSEGSPNKRSTRICPMHKARSLANVYYWNKLYDLFGREKAMPMFLPKDEALRIIDEEEWNMLRELSGR